MDIVNIPETEKQFKDEWLLFEVLETDQLNRPYRGRLLFHSKDREEANKKLLETEDIFIYLTFTGEPIPKGSAVVI